MKREENGEENEEGVGNFFFCVVVKKGVLLLSFQSVNSVFSLKKKVSLFSTPRRLLVGKKHAQ